MNIDTKVYRKHESPTFGNTVLYEVPTYLALNSNRSDKQKNKKKKKGYGKRLIWKRNCKRCIT